MPARRFEFDLQPALDKAHAEKEQCEERLKIASENLKTEQNQLRQRRTQRAETRIRIRHEYHRLVPAQGERLTATQLQAKSRFIEFLRQQAIAQAAAIESQRQRRDDARQILRDRLEDLAVATARAEAVQRLKEKKQEEFKAELEHAEEMETEDQVIQRWRGNSGAVHGTGE